MVSKGHYEVHLQILGISELHVVRSVVKKDAELNEKL